MESGHKRDRTEDEERPEHQDGYKLKRYKTEERPPCNDDEEDQDQEGYSGARPASAGSRSALPTKSNAANLFMILHNASDKSLLECLKKHNLPVDGDKTLWVIRLLNHREVMHPEKPKVLSEMLLMFVRCADLIVQEQGLHLRSGSESLEQQIREALALRTCADALKSTQQLQYQAPHPPSAQPLQSQLLPPPILSYTTTLPMGQRVTTTFKPSFDALRCSVGNTTPRNSIVTSSYSDVNCRISPMARLIHANAALSGENKFNFGPGIDIHKPAAVAAPTWMNATNHQSTASGHQN